MTIAAEAAAYKATGFSGVPTFRWESAVKVTDSAPPFLGDYSIGPMQTSATTAHGLIRAKQLPYQPLTVFPAYRTQPNIPPANIPGYRPEINIHIGGAEIRSRWTKAGATDSDRRRRQRRRAIRLVEFRNLQKSLEPTLPGKSSRPGCALVRGCLRGSWIAAESRVVV